MDTVSIKIYNELQTLFSTRSYAVPFFLFNIKLIAKVIAKEMDDDWKEDSKMTKAYNARIIGYNKSLKDDRKHIKNIEIIKKFVVDTSGDSSNLTSKFTSLKTKGVGDIISGLADAATPLTTMASLYTDFI